MTVIRISKKSAKKLNDIRSKHQVSFANALDAYLERIGDRSVVNVKRKRGKKLEFKFKQKGK